MIMNCMYRGTSILEPLFRDVFIITNDNLYPGNSKIYEKKNSIQRTSVQRSSHYNGRYSSPQKLVKYIRKNDLNITKPFYRKRILPSLRYLIKTLLSVLQPTSQLNTEIRSISRVHEITYRPKAIFLLDAVACHPFSMERLHRPLPQGRVEGAII